MNSPIREWAPGETGGASMLPEVRLSDLDGKEYVLPRDFPTHLTLVLFGFTHEQREELHTWVEPMLKLQAEYPNLTLYEVPVISESSAALRTVIRNGMRAGTSDPRARERTLTLFVDKEKFTQALGMPQTDHVFAALFERDGRVIWKESGAASENKLAQLRNLLGIPAQES